MDGWHNFHFCCGTVCTSERAYCTHLLCHSACLPPSSLFSTCTCLAAVRAASDGQPRQWQVGCRVCCGVCGSDTMRVGVVCVCDGDRSTTSHTPCRRSVCVCVPLDEQDAGLLYSFFFLSNGWGKGLQAVCARQGNIVASRFMTVSACLKMCWFHLLIQPSHHNSCRDSRAMLLPCARAAHRVVPKQRWQAPGGDRWCTMLGVLCCFVRVCMVMVMFCMW